MVPDHLPLAAFFAEDVGGPELEARDLAVRVISA
jgi:hypothetical protein